MCKTCARRTKRTTLPVRRVGSTTTVPFYGEVWPLCRSHRLAQEFTDNATAIGPTRLYNIGKIYSGLLHFFWIGALLPIITYALRKKYPKSRFLDAIHWPIFFAGTGNLPPAVWKTPLSRVLLYANCDGRRVSTTPRRL